MIQQAETGGRRGMEGRGVGGGVRRGRGREGRGREKDEDKNLQTVRERRKMERCDVTLRELLVASHTEEDFQRRPAEY